MKKTPILKWLIIGIFFLILMAIGILGAAPLAYALRHSIIEDEKKWWNHLGLVWFTDNSENWGSPYQNYVNNWWGVYEIFNRDYDKFETLNNFRKFLLNYRWMAWRNPHWRVKRALAPIGGLFHSIKFIINTLGRDSDNIQWLSLKERGMLFGYYWIDDEKFFRLAWNVNFWLFVKLTHHFEIGTRHVGQSRYAAKSKFRKR